jgi:quercetin dioxygenase-like cupin family protein
MKPNETTGWHRHDAPLVAWIVEGEVTVDYGASGTKTFKAGQAFVEAFKSDHNGRNTGSGDTRILAVFVGAEGVSNTHMQNAK